MAPVANLRTMLAAGSTSFSGTGRGSPVSASTPRIRSRPRSVISRRDWSSTSEVYSLKISYRRLRVACCSLKTVSGLNRCGSPPAGPPDSGPPAAAPGVPPAGGQPPVLHPGRIGQGHAGPLLDLRGQGGEIHAGQPRGGAGEAGLDHLRAQADGLEDLRAGVGGDG